jgi:hypothetical protein
VKIYYNYIDSNNCSAIDSQTINVSICTGNKNNKNNNIIRIFPNPASNEINIEILPDILENPNFKLVNVAGDVFNLNTEFTGFNSYKFFIGSLPAGVYFLIIEVSEARYVRKIVKEK